MGTLNRTVVAPLSSAIIAVLLAGIVVVGVDGVDRGLREGEARLRAQGVVEVSVGGSAFVRVSHGRILGRQDQVRVLEGKAVVELPHSSKAELRKGSAITVVGGRDPALVLDAGDLLVESGRGGRVNVDGGTARVSVGGAAKLRRGVSLAVGVYDGGLRLSRNERALTVPRYRQAAVVGTGVMPAAAEPLALSAADEWDRRLLGRVLSLDQQINLFARAFETQLSAPDPGPDLYKSVVPGLDDLPISAEFVAGRAAAENLIGLTLVSLDRGDFTTRVQRIFGFRAAGASWGLVAADRDLNPNPILTYLEAAVGWSTPGAVSRGELAGPILAVGVGGPGRNGANGADLVRQLPATIPGILPIGQGGADGAGQPAGGTPPAGAPPGSQPPGQPPSGSPPREKTIDLPPTGPLLDPLIDPIENLLSGLLDGLFGPAPESTDILAPAPGPTPTPTTSEPVLSISVGSTSPTTSGPAT